MASLSDRIVVETVLDEDAEHDKTFLNGQVSCRW